VNTRLLKALTVSAAGLLVPLRSHAQAIDLPDIPQCTQLLPGAIAVDSVPVTLHLRVLLDGVTQARAQEVVSAAQAAYTPQQLSLSASYEAISPAASLPLKLTAS
jgi:hypothetical protein